MFPWQLGWMVWETQDWWESPGWRVLEEHPPSNTTGLGPQVCAHFPLLLFIPSCFHPYSWMFLKSEFMQIILTWSIFSTIQEGIWTAHPHPHPQEWFSYSFFIQLFIQTHNLLVHSLPIYWASAVWVWRCLRCWGNSSAQGGFTFLLLISSCA